MTGKNLTHLSDLPAQTWKLSSSFAGLEVSNAYSVYVFVPPRPETRFPAWMTVAKEDEREQQAGHWMRTLLDVAGYQKW